MMQKTFIALFGGLVATSVSIAQTQSGSPQKEEEVVTLSVFEVNAGDDRGYQAGNTISGSRLNARLKDTPAAISVFTPEFLSDIAANSITEMLEYATNVEPEFEDSNGGFNNPDATDPNYSTPSFRIRGMAGSVSTDLIESTSVQDNYNIERVELSSGPNSVLFGLGAAGGIVALSTKRANLARDRGTIKTQFGSWKRERYETDYNKVILPGKLGVRLMGVRSDTEGWRHWDFEDMQSWTGAIAAKPWAGTTIHASYSKTDYRKHITQPWNAQNQVSHWLDTGSLVRDGTGVPDRGVVAFNNNNRFTFFNQTASVANLRAELQSVGHFPAKNGNFGVLLAPEMMPYDYSLGGPGARREQDSVNIKASIEHRFSRDFSVELAFLRSASDTTVFNFGGADNALRGDPNLTYAALNGSGTTPNPLAGGLYLEAGASANSVEFENDVLRLTGAYEFNLEKWGRHRFALLGETGKVYRYHYGGAEILVDDNGVPISNAAAPENATNRLWRRNYVTPGDFTTYHVSDIRSPFPATTINGRTYRARIVNGGGTGESIKLTDSLLFASQNYWWKNKLVTTFGYRIDKIGFKDGATARVMADDPRVAQGLFVPNEWAHVPGEFVRNDFRAITRTMGAVFHAHERVSLFYNQSTNVGAPRLDRTILPGVLPEPTDGDGQDMGVILDLTGDGRFVMRGNYFQTKFLRDTPIIPGQPNYFVGGTSTVLDTLLAANRITPAEFDAHSVNFRAFMIDVISKGWELELVANPTQNWTVRLGYSYSERGRANYFLEREPYYTEFLALVDRADPGRRLLTENGNTIGEEIDIINDTYESTKEGQEQSFGTRPHKANVTTKYSFTAGILKGAFVGGSYKFQSKNYMQSDSTAPNPVGRTYYGDPIWGADAFVGYNVRLPWKGKRLLLQLNVYNVFNESLIEPARYNFDFTGMRRVYLREPRAWRLTTTFSF